MARIRVRSPLSDRRLREIVLELARMLIRHENRGQKENDLLDEVSLTLLEHFQAEAVEIWLGRGPFLRRYGRSRGGQSGFRPLPREPCRLNSLCRSVAHRDFDPSLRPFEVSGSLLLDDPWENDAEPAEDSTGSWRSLAVLPLEGGVLLLAGPEPAWIRPEELPALVEIAGMVGLGVSIHQPREALEERVKELGCLYGLSRLAQQPYLSLRQLLQGIAEQIPPAWQHPEFACCRITFDNDAFLSAGFRESLLRQDASILVLGARRGGIEVFYNDEAPGVDRERPFLPEERNLIDGLAREVALIIERRQLEMDQENLWEQIRHMDRLATIGQLAASVAHELNEPLCSILGLAQLVSKDQELSPQARGDIKKIVEASLHAREVVKSLLGFSRTEPARKACVALNRIVEDVLGLFSARCARAQVAIVFELRPGIPRVRADPAQIHQVLVNLVVNAIHAMPEGGTLTLRTRVSRGRVELSVVDSGIGMNDETLRQIFIPFFTTKRTGHGTGLGLGIVQNIVTTLGGTLTVESQPGKGSCFTVELPVDERKRIEDRPHG